MDLEPTYIYVAGIGNSGPDHWQYQWYKRGGNGVWVEHGSWDAPVRDEWVADLDAALASTAGEKVIIAHSLGCSVVAAWAAEHTDEAVTGALLVAVPNVLGPAFPAAAVGFASLNYSPLPFPAVVVSSTDDPYGTAGHAAEVAGQLGARLVDVGPKGHVNADSGLGDWPEGWGILRGLDGPRPGPAATTAEAH